MRTTFLCLAAVVIVGGCNPPPPEKTVFDPQVRALKKAKAVEGQLQQAAERQREQIDAATEPGQAPNPNYEYR